ncbi:3,5-dihydroxyphenylacetyl-CoA synthase DpgA [Actinoplanes sp. NPDC051346]|uniref:3,5-dihydroxyphenylacetyl-CoA synthase DpgA n=1 Tax=Actinoplanes sp. NPDC051346 TaxID=3155048 RepID=UPI0034147DBC
MARILSVGTAVPANSYSQEDLLQIFGITDPKVRSVFLNSAIDRRFLTLPEPNADGFPAAEDTGRLLAKHKSQGIAMGSRAVQEALKRIGADISDVRYLCCTTSTGFLTPGFSALLIKELGLSRHTSRADVVGMGCNAGLNSLNVTSGWARGRPGELAVMVCIEACSAAYVFDGTMRSAVVNSLFGDGAAAVAIAAGADRDAAPGSDLMPRIIDFVSCIIPEAVDAMRYDWDSVHHGFSFYLDPDIPYVVGANARATVGQLLQRNGLRQSDIAHWLVHSGGKKVIDAVGVNLGLTRYDLRHTIGVLRDYGNLSSGSFLFSYERLLNEESVQRGEYGLLMTMGPGSTIETALVRW